MTAVSKLDNPQCRELVLKLLNTIFGAGSADAEVGTAARALKKTLDGNTDELIKRVTEKPFGHDDMKMFYEAARKKALEDLMGPAEKYLVTHEGVGGYRWETIVDFCSRNTRKLDHWEKNFITGLAMRRGGGFSERETEIIARVFTTRFEGQIK
jgi:hypothetical protein